MSLRFVLLLLSCGVLAAGCATTAATSEDVVGSFRWGVDPDNASYLVLKQDGSYQYSKVSTAPERFAPVPPFQDGEGSGRWQIEGQDVVLGHVINAGPTHYQIHGRGARLELHPVYGAGYIPSPGFRRITDEECARHSLIVPAPTPS